MFTFLRNLLKNKNVDIVSPYKEVTKAKTNPFPISTAIQVTETGAIIRLQDLSDHNAARLLKVKDAKPENVKQLKLILKYGGDGTYGFNPYELIRIMIDDTVCQYLTGT